MPDPKTGRPPKHTPKVLRGILSAMLKPYTGLEDAAKKHKVSVQRVYAWQKQSAWDEMHEVADSPFLISYLDQKAFFHRHLAFCRAVAVARIDARIIEAATVPHREPLYSAQTGVPFFEVCPLRAAAAKSMSDDQWQLEYGSADHVPDRSDIYKRDHAGALIPMFREVPPQPALLIKAAASLLSATYGDRVSHQVTVGGVVRIGATTTPPPKQLTPPPTFQILDVDFTPIDDDGKASEPTNVLAVAEEPETVADFERTFGGKRLVEAILFYAEDRTLLAPVPEIIIVDGSSIHRAYQEAGIEVNAVPASQLLAQGYINDFLIDMATPEERALAEVKRKEPPVYTPKPQAPLPALDDDDDDDEPEPVATDTRVSRDPFMNVDGTPKSGGFSVSGTPQLRRRTVL